MLLTFHILKVVFQIYMSSSGFFGHVAAYNSRCIIYTVTQRQHSHMTQLSQTAAMECGKSTRQGSILHSLPKDHFWPACFICSYSSFVDTSWLQRWGKLTLRPPPASGATKRSPFIKPIIMWVSHISSLLTWRLWMQSHFLLRCSRSGVFHYSHTPCFPFASTLMN